MCQYHKLSFAPQQPLRPYLRQETQGMSGVCTQQWECLLQPSLSLLQVRPKHAWIFDPSFSLTSPRKGSWRVWLWQLWVSQSCLRTPRCQLPACTISCPNPEKHICDLDPLYWEPQKPRALFQVPACFRALSTRCLTDEDESIALKSVQESNGRNK